MKRLLSLLLLLTLIQWTANAQNPHALIPGTSQMLATDPPNQYNDYFAGAGACLLCHNTQVNEQGASVAIVNDWRSTMMANSAKDPFWQAKVSHEILVNPQYADEIQTVCTRCHAPMGNINALNNGADHYTLVDMRADALGMDGASCTVCHQITEGSLGNSSGAFLIGNKEIFGPYPTPFSNPMVNNTGYTPYYSEHIKDSRLCESCHTLITNPLDLNGVPTGDEFVEQSPYQEWKNSIYPAEETSCYTCHVPEIQDVVKISSMPAFIDGRTPFGKHHLAGGNAFMLKLIKNNLNELEITANDQQLDSTIARTYQNLQLKTLELAITEQNRTLDSLFVDLSITNLAGHKIPTSYPSRRIFVELLATNSQHDTLFHSGKMDADFNLINESVDYEPHYNLINQQEQVQIYEMVMGDVNGDLTTVLERAYIHLKDNRLPPKGFTKTHISYDTTKIVGQALFDSDFNTISGLEGSGSDIIHYRIPLDDITDQLLIEARIYYQTVSNKWLQEMFTHSSDEIDLFKSMYTNTDKSPVLMTSKSISSIYTSVWEMDGPGINLFPNPTNGSFSIATTAKVSAIRIFTLSGKEIYLQDNLSGESLNYQINLENKKGVFIVSVKTDHKISYRKLIIN
jgi:cytochrome c553